MKGKVEIHVSNKKIAYKFSLHRNITFIKGDSASGKTVLYNMVNDFMKNGINSGVKLTYSCGDGCIALSDFDWKMQLKTTTNKIVFIDEGFRGFHTSDDVNEFVKIIKKTDNYYVIFCRENFENIPSSVEEIYQIKTSKKYHELEKYYKINKTHWLSSSEKNDENFVILLTEDSKAGKQFFDYFFKSTNVKVLSANGNSNIFNILNNNSSSRVLAIVDGAAFGPYIDKIDKLCKANKNVNICLPESFEWMILKSNIINDKKVKKILDDTSSMIDIKKYFTWENFFEKELVELTKNKQSQYSKKKLSQYYLNAENVKKIALVIGLKKK